MICHCSYFAHCARVCVCVSVYLLELRPVGGWTEKRWALELGHVRPGRGRAEQPEPVSNCRFKGVKGLGWRRGYLLFVCLFVCIVGLNASTVGLETKQLRPLKCKFWKRNAHNPSMLLLLLLQHRHMYQLMLHSCMGIDSAAALP